MYACKSIVKKYYPNQSIIELNLNQYGKENNNFVASTKNSQDSQNSKNGRKESRIEETSR